MNLRQHIRKNSFLKVKELFRLSYSRYYSRSGYQNRLSLSLSLPPSLCHLFFLPCLSLSCFLNQSSIYIYILCASAFINHKNPNLGIKDLEDPGSETFSRIKKRHLALSEALFKHILVDPDHPQITASTWTRSFPTPKFQPIPSGDFSSAEVGGAVAVGAT